MSRLSRAALALLLPMLAIALSSCAGSPDLCILGYTTAPQYPGHIRTVHVPIFKNETFVRGLEFELTEAVIKQIEQKTPWKVVQCGDADAVLTGKIVALSKRTLLHNELNEVREAELALGVEIDFKDLIAATPNVDPLAEPLPRRPATALPEDEPALFGLRRGGKRLGKRAPNFVEAEAAFVPELGESIATARQRVVTNLATQIVGMLETPW